MGVDGLMLDVPVVMSYKDGHIPAFWFLLYVKIRGPNLDTNIL